MSSANTFIFPVWLIPQTALNTIILPFFLCEYGTCSIKLLADTVCWNTELLPAPEKRMIIWRYLLSPSWLRVQRSFPLEETRGDNNRHRGHSLMSNCLEKKTSPKRWKIKWIPTFSTKNTTQFLKKDLKLDVVCLLFSWGTCCFISPKFRSVGRQFDSWDHPCTSAGPSSACCWPGKEGRPIHCL